MTNAFLRGFSDATGLSMPDANKRWTDVSRRLSWTELRRIERRGYAGGLREGRRWAAMYADEIKDDNQENAK